jgi:osmotically-inducible protein OsmY
MRIPTAGNEADIGTAAGFLHSSQPRRGSVKSDGDIRCAVEAELSAHPLVDDTDIVVNVRRGVVTLSGYVRNLFHKYGAEDAAKRVAGVTAVANTIDLHRGRRGNLTDPEIACAAVCALKRALPDCAPRIRPLVRERTVTLEGTVNLPYQRQLAEDAVRRLADVVSVFNTITLAHGVDVVEAGRSGSGSKSRSEPAHSVADRDVR